MKKGYFRRCMVAVASAGALILSVLAGCGGKAEEKEDLENTEIFGTYTISQNAAFRIDGGEFLRYVDVETGQVGYYCNKPACLHNDKSCGAYFEGMITAFFYQGKLYVLTRAHGDTLEGLVIIKCDITGENRQEIPVKSQVLFENAFTQVSDGKVYMLGKEFKDKKYNETVDSIYAVSLEDGTAECLVRAEEENENLAHFWVVGDKIVYTRFICDTNMKELFQEQGSFEGISWDEIHFTYRLEMYDMAAGNRDLVGETVMKGTESSTISMLCVEEDDLYYKNEQDIIIRYDYDTKESELIGKLPAEYDEWEILDSQDIGEGVIIPFLEIGVGAELVWFDESFQEYRKLGITDYPNASCEGRCGDKVWFQNSNTIFYIDIEDLRNEEYHIHAMPEL